MMDPTDLNDDELSYELRIRGITSLGDRRVGTKALRIDINNELKGLKSVPKTSPLIAKFNLTPLERIINDLAKEVGGAIGRRNESAKKLLISKMIHYLGKINRLEGTDAEEVSRIEKLQELVKQSMNDLSKPHETAAAVTDIADARDKGAIPKTVRSSDQRPDETLDEINGGHLNGAEGGETNRQEERVIAADRNISQTSQSNILNFSMGSQSGGNVTQTNRPVESQVVASDHNISQFSQRGQQEKNFLQKVGDGGLNVQAASFLPNPFAPANNNRRPLNRVGVTDFDDILNNTNFGNQVSGNGGYRFSNEQNVNTNALNTNRYSFQNARPSEHNINYEPFRQNQTINRSGSNTFEANRPQAAYRNRRNPVAEWNIFFSGDNKEMSLNDFLSQVSLFARAEHLSDNDLLTSAVYLFKGSAYTWYRAFYPYYNSWAQLVAGLKEQFLPVDYDFWLLRELEQRRQGESENFGIYCAAMEMLFRNLSYNMSERQRLAIVMRNMSPVYAERLALEDIRSLAQLAFKCRKIEEVRYRIGRQIMPQIQRRDLLEPAFSYNHPGPSRFRVAEMETQNYNEPDYVEVAAIGNTTQRTNLCYNCGEPGHRFNQCRSERKLFCYKCGTSGCTVNSCRRCQIRSQGNGPANSRQGESMNSRAYQN